MHDAATHSFLSQIPLIISPFLKVPQPVSLPLNYAPLPRALPPSSAALFSEVKTILASVEDQEKQVVDRHEHAKRVVAKWEEQISQAETMHQRQIAPGYLDSKVHMLEPRHLDDPSSTASPVLSAASVAPPQSTVPVQPTPIHAATFADYSAPAAPTPAPAQQSLISVPPTPAPQYGYDRGYSSPVYAPQQQQLYTSPPVQSPNVPPFLSHSASFHGDASVYQSQSSIYDPPSYQSHQPPIPEPSPAFSRRPSAQRQVSSSAHSVRSGSPAPSGPPLPPRPPYELIHRPLRLSTMRKPTIGEFPWARAAAEAARSLRGGDAGRPPAGGYGSVAAAEQPYSLQRTDSNRTDVSTLYETPAFRRSSLPRLDSYRGRDSSFGSLDAKLSEYLGRPPTVDSELPKYTSSTRTTLDPLPEKSIFEPSYLRDYSPPPPPPAETAQLIDLDDEEPAPLQSPKPSSELIGNTSPEPTFDAAAPGPEPVSADGLPAYLSTDPAGNLYPSVDSKVPLSGDYLDAPANETADLHETEVAKPSAESDDDFDFEELMKPQSSASLLARPQETEPEVDAAAAADLPDKRAFREDADAEAADADAEPSEPVPAGVEDEAAIDAMLKALQDEIDEEERAEARAKREARRQALAAKAAAEAAAAETAQDEGDEEQTGGAVFIQTADDEAAEVKPSAEEEEIVDEKVPGEDEEDAEVVPTESTEELKTPEEYERATDAHAAEYEDATAAAAAADSDLNLTATDFYSRAESDMAGSTESAEKEEDSVEDLSEAQAIRNLGQYEDQPGKTMSVRGRKADEIELDELKSKVPEVEVEEQTEVVEGEVIESQQEGAEEVASETQEEDIDSDETGKDYEIISMPSSDAEEHATLPAPATTEEDIVTPPPPPAEEEFEDRRGLEYESDLIANEWGSVVPDSFGDGYYGGYRAQETAPVAAETTNESEEVADEMVEDAEPSADDAVEPSADDPVENPEAVAEQAADEPEIAEEILEAPETVGLAAETEETSEPEATSEPDQTAEEETDAKPSESSEGGVEEEVIDGDALVDEETAVADESISEPALDVEEGSAEATETAEGAEETPDAVDVDEEVNETEGVEEPVEETADSVDVSEEVDEPEKVDESEEVEEPEEVENPAEEADEAELAAAVDETEELAVPDEQLVEGTLTGEEAVVEGTPDAVEPINAEETSATTATADELEPTPVEEATVSEEVEETSAEEVSEETVQEEEAVVEEEDAAEAKSDTVPEETADDAEPEEPAVEESVAATDETAEEESVTSAGVDTNETSEVAEQDEEPQAEREESDGESEA